MRIAASIAVTAFLINRTGNRSEVVVLNIGAPAQNDEKTGLKEFF